jgi:hypothetical protein
MGWIFFCQRYIISLTFQSAGNMSRVKQKLKKFLMWGIKEGARSLTNLRDTLFNPIASDVIEKTASAASCADTLWNEKGVKSWNRTENATPPAPVLFARTMIILFPFFNIMHMH